MRTHIKKKIIGFFVLLILAVSVIAVNIWQKNKDSVIATSLSKKADISVDTNLLSYKGKKLQKKKLCKGNTCSRYRFNGGYALYTGCRLGRTG